MRYSVNAYLTDATKLRAMFRSKNEELHKEMLLFLKKKFPPEDIEEDAVAFSILRDFIYNGEVRFPEEEDLYGFVYVFFCEFFGEEIAADNEDTDEYLCYCFWDIYPESSFFVDLPSLKYGYTLISIPFEKLMEEKEKFIRLEKQDGLTDEQMSNALKKLEYIFGRAFAEKKDLVFLCDEFT